MSFASLAQTETFNNMVTTTLKAIEPMLQQQIYPAIPVANHMLKTGKVKMYAGGLQLAVGVVGAENPNFEWYNGSTVAADDESEQFTRALYDWSLCRVAVKISDEDVDKNSGDKVQLHNLLMELIENAKRTFINRVSQALNGTRTATNQLMGIGDFIKEATGVTVGGLSPTTNDWWENERTTSGVTFRASAALPGNLKESMNNLYNRCITRTNPTERDGLFWVTTSDIFEGYEASLEDIARFMLTDSRKESLGFGQADVLSYKNRPIYWDDAAPAEEVKLVNSNFLRLAIHSKRNFSWDEARTYPNAHATVSYGRFMAQLVCNFRQAQGGLFNVVADT